MLYRAYHSTPSTVPANGVHGFLAMLTRTLLNRKSTGVVICCDDDWRPAFRTDELPSYKAQRVSDVPDPVTPQEALGREVLLAIGFAVVGHPGFEAEDVIATVAARTDEPVEVLSGDRDLFALVEDSRVRVLYPAKGGLQEVDERWIEEKYGIPGRAYGDFALLRGDPSDGLPGVPGVGEKTAARLISAHGSLQALLQCSTLPAALRSKLDGAADYLAAAQRVVLPRADLPLGPVNAGLPRKVRDPAELHRLLAEHSLENAVGRLVSELGIAVE